MYFSFGANSTTGNLKSYLPNCVVYGIAISSGGTITSAVDVEVIINSTTYTYSVPVGTHSVYTNYNLSISVLQGQTLQAKFGTAGSGGTDFRISLFCRTSAVNGTNGTNGTNGQNVSFNTPTITTITPATSASINDTIVTASGTQTHSLNFNIPRGKNASFQVGTISSVGTASPSLDITQSTNGNGDNVYTMNFGLQQGIQGIQGQKGDKGNNGNQAESTLESIAAAAISTAAAGAASASAAAAAASALTAAAAGAAAGGQAGAEAAEGVLAEQNVRITQLETDVDALQYKTNYISRNAGETTIGGSRTIVNSTYGLLTNTMEAESINVGNTINTNDLNVIGQSYFADNITLADTKSLNTNIIRQRQYPAAGDILIDAINLDIGSSFCDSIDVIGDNINIRTNEVNGITTFNCAFANTDTQVVVDGSLQAKNFTTQTIEVTNNNLPLNIGEDTNELQLLSNNIAIGNLEVAIESQTLINNKNISIGETLANSVVNIGGANSKISCDGTTDTITMDTQEILIETNEIDINSGDITLGNALDLNTNILIQNRNVNIATTQIGMTAPTLNIGTYNRTTTELRGETIQILASETTSINGSNNLEIDATHIVMGNAGGDVVINGASIDIGTAGIFNTINIGNDYSVVNINAGIGQYINVADYFNQLGY